MKRLTIKNLEEISDMIDETLDIGRGDDPNSADWHKMEGVLFSGNEALIVKRLIKKFLEQEVSE